MTDYTDYERLIDEIVDAAASVQRTGLAHGDRSQQARLAETELQASRAALVAYIEAVTTERTCQWRYMDWPMSESDFEGACGVAWSFSDGGIEANGVRYCPKCGGHVLVPVKPASCFDCGTDIDADAVRCDECVAAILDGTDTARTDAQENVI